MTAAELKALGFVTEADVRRIALEVIEETIGLPLSDEQHADIMNDIMGHHGQG